MLSLDIDNFATDELMEQVSRLSASLSKEASSNIGGTTFRSKSLVPECLSNERKRSVSDVQPLSADDRDVQILDLVTEAHEKDRDNAIVLSESETEEPISADEVIQSDTRTGYCNLEGKTAGPGLVSNVRPLSVDDRDVQILDLVTEAHEKDSDNMILLSESETEESISADKVIQSDTKRVYCNLDGKIAGPGSAMHSDPTKKKVSCTDTSKNCLESFQQKDATDGCVVASQDKGFDRLKGIPASASLLESKDVDSKRKEIDSKYKKNESQSHNGINLNNSSVLKEIVHYTEDDPFESALKSARLQQSFMAKSNTSLPKRQVIQLKSSFQNRSGHLHRPGSGVKRFKPPKLDDWYRPILEIDYFATVGLASTGADGSRIVSKFKEVPVCFQSPEQYVEIFRPLVLEEFKAQLHSSFLEMPSWEEMYFGSLSVMVVDFHLVRFVYDDNDSAASRNLSENDIVLITKEPLQKSSHDIHMVGKVCPYITL